MCKSPLFSVHWNETFVICENPSKYMFSANTIVRFTVFTTNFDIQKRKWANISLFSCDILCSMFRGHIFAKRFNRFRWFKKYKNITIRPSIKTGFKFYRIFIQPVFLIMWKEMVVNIWPRGDPIATLANIFQYWLKFFFHIMRKS